MEKERKKKKRRSGQARRGHIYRGSLAPAFSTKIELPTLSEGKSYLACNDRYTVIINNRAALRPRLTSPRVALRAHLYWKTRYGPSQNKKRTTSTMFTPRRTAAASEFLGSPRLMRRRSSYASSITYFLQKLKMRPDQQIAKQELYSDDFGVNAFTAGNPFLGNIFTWN